MPEVSEKLRMSLNTHRMPVFEQGVAPRTKIEELESYLLLTAFTQGELSEERIDVLRDLEEVQREWEHLAGYTVTRKTRTEAAVTDAKREIRPDLYDRKRELEWRVKRLSEEIDRLERDSVKASRAYSMVTGT